MKRASTSDPKRRQYGTGGVRERGGRFYIRYSDGAGKQREEFGGESEAAAKRLLAQRVGEIAAGAGPAKATGDVTVGECLDLLLADYRRRGKDSRDAKWRIEGKIRPLIGHQRATRFGHQQAWGYVDARRGDGVKDATINRELSLIRRSLRMAASDEYGMLAKAPKIPMLDEGDNVRTGFLTPAEYGRMRDALPDYLRPLLCVAYYTGLRRGTLLSLRLDQVDLAAGLIWVSRVQTKNRRSQTAPIVAGEMRRFCELAVANNRRYLFEREGNQILSFKNAWTMARVEAGLPNLRFHDLRRTAVRDWLAAGANQGTVMAISGHKTVSMLQRYNIIEAADIQKAAKLREPEVAPVEIRERLGKSRTAKPS